MDYTTNTEIESFLKKIKDGLYHLAPAEEYIETLRQDMYEYYKDNPNLTENDLAREFGEAYDIANDYLELKCVTKPQNIAKSRGKRNFIIAVLLICLVAVGVCLIEVLHDQQAMATDVIIVEE